MVEDYKLLILKDFFIDFFQSESYHDLRIIIFNILRFKCIWFASEVPYGN